jgi:outer membrane protein
LISRQYFLFLLLFGFLYSGSAVAQQSKTAPPASGTEAPLRVIVMSIENIRRNSVAVKNIREQIAGYRKEFQAGIQKEESALRSANQELAKKRTILSPEAFAKERRQFEQRVIGVQKLVQKRKRQLDQAQVESMVKVEERMNQIVANIAQSRNASLVLRRAQTVLVARGLDVTAEVLARLNKELVDVPVKKPSD